MTGRAIALRLREGGVQDHPVLRFLVVRAAAGVLTLWVLSVLVFVCTQVLPGDAARAILGREATPEALGIVRAQLHLDEPVVAQYGHWLGGIVQGDLGQSASQQRVGDPNETVASLIRDPLGNTAILAGIAIGVLIPLSLLIGTVLALRVGRPLDYVVSTMTLGAISLPEFVTAALLIAVFANTLDLVPAVSLLEPGQSPLSRPEILLLPVLTLLASSMAQSVRMVRASMIETLASPYVTAARLAGVRERRVVWRYALRNALAPTVQVFAFLSQWLVGAVVVAETVFGYPGLGTVLVNAVDARDITLVQAIAMIFAAVYVAVNILADLVVMYLIPQLRSQR